MWTGGGRRGLVESKETEMGRSVPCRAGTREGEEKGTAGKKGQAGLFGARTEERQREKKKDEREKKGQEREREKKGQAGLFGARTEKRERDGREREREGREREREREREKRRKGKQAGLEQGQG